MRRGGWIAVVIVACLMVGTLAWWFFADTGETNELAGKASRKLGRVIARLDRVEAELEASEERNRILLRVVRRNDLEDQVPAQALGQAGGSDSSSSDEGPKTEPNDGPKSGGGKKDQDPPPDPDPEPSPSPDGEICVRLEDLEGCADRPRL